MGKTNGILAAFVLSGCAVHQGTRQLDSSEYISSPLEKHIDSDPFAPSPWAEQIDVAEQMGMTKQERLDLVTKEYQKYKAAAEELLISYNRASLQSQNDMHDATGTTFLQLNREKRELETTIENYGLMWKPNTKGDREGRPIKPSKRLLELNDSLSLVREKILWLSKTYSNFELVERLDESYVEAAGNMLYYAQQVKWMKKKLGIEKE